MKRIIVESPYSGGMALSHYEAAANAIIGAGLGQVVLWVFGLPLAHAIGLNAAMIAVSYIRAFAIRRMFVRLG